jgi:16S rRNA processing protein RimM
VAKKIGCELHEFSRIILCELCGSLFSLRYQALDGRRPTILQTFNVNNYFKIGKLAATYRLQGEMILLHGLGKKTSLKGLETVFIEEKKDSFIPWFIESAKSKSDTEIYIKLEGIDTKEAAHKLIQKEIWLLEDDFKKFAGAAAPISLLGYSIINEDEDLGEILEVIEQPHQLLCKIMLNGKEALIPIHEEFLDKVDKKNRKVFVTLPDGLLEIYK